MPKNIIPKDNNPKIFEVREVENQIPSYEEFLKSYQQEQVNYEDLTHIDIGSSKSYGPMWGNSQQGERWTNLRIPCLAFGCKNTAITNLIHIDGCGGNLEISNRARIRCLQCGKVDHLGSWYLICSNHRISYSWTIPSASSLQSALEMALSNGSMDRSVVVELLRFLGR